MSFKPNEMANNAWLLLASRVAAVLIIPWLGMLSMMLLDLKDITTNLNAAVLLALEPRLDVVEKELRDVRAEMNARTANRFTRIDAQPLEAKVDNLDREMAAIKAIIERMEKRQ